MRIPAIVLLLVCAGLIALGRYFIRRARKRRRQNPAAAIWRGRVAGWALVTIGFLAMLVGVCIW